MTDRELLEAAAMASGIEWGHYSSGYGKGLHVKPKGMSIEYYWNPLTDDGDALRLAVKLGINCWRDGDTIWCNGERVGFDEPNAATRRAIVKAAADIAEGMRAKSEWVGLTDEEIEDVFAVKRGNTIEKHLLGCARAIEAKLKAMMKVKK
jgi:hypothetical protein